MNSKLLELTYLRCFATLSLVIWHCIFCPMAVRGIIKDISSFLQEHYLLFPTILTLVVLPLSYFLTKVSLKTKIGNFLLA